jgi:hypothetical protein
VHPPDPRRRRARDQLGHVLGLLQDELRHNYWKRNWIGMCRNKRERESFR